MEIDVYLPEKRLTHKLDDQKRDRLPKERVRFSFFLP